jgi:hypothetical protein
MNFINPEFTTKCILGVNGCVYKSIDHKWNLIFEYPDWINYVVKNYEQYLERKIEFEDFIESISNTDNYKKMSGYNGELANHLFGSCQYHTIYKMWFMLEVLDYLDIFVLEDYFFCSINFLDYQPILGYEQDIINYVKADAIDLFKSHTVPYGFRDGKILTHHQICREHNRASNSYKLDRNQYYGCPCPLDKISNDHLRILEDKYDEFMKNLEDQLSVFTLSTEQKEKILKKFKMDRIDVKHIITPNSCGNPADYKFIEEEIMWDHPDLIYDHYTTILNIPLKTLPEKDKLRHLETFIEQTNTNVYKLESIHDAKGAINYHFNHTDMWCFIPKLFELVFRKDIQYTTDPLTEYQNNSSKRESLSQDSERESSIEQCSENYKRGAQIFVMLKHGVVPHVTDFYCPNT